LGGIKAIARAFRQLEIPEKGTYATIAEIAAAEKIDESYVEAILDERQAPEITLAVLMRPFAVAWTEQRKTLIGCLPRSLACLDAVA
jgi:hypothetical protein